MRVLLVHPPQNFAVNSGLPAVLEEESGWYPPLGLMYVASYARAATNADIEILYAPLEAPTPEAIRRAIRERKPDLVGISTMTFMLLDALDVARAAKEWSPDCKVVLGGPHTELYPYESIRFPEIDYLVLGEGEVPFARLLRALESGEELGEIAGIVYRKGDAPMLNAPEPPPRDLDALPFPDRAQIPWKRFYSLGGRSSRVTTLITSRGCPYHCTFCGSNAITFRARSAANICDEVEACLRLGVREIYFYDNSFNADRDRVFEICEEIRRRDLRFAFSIRANINPMDDRMAYVLRRAGCFRIQYGVESGTQEILDKMRKDITLEDVRRTFRMTRAAGMETLAYFIIGYPGESPRHMRATMRFALEIGADMAVFSRFVPRPGTDVYVGEVSRSADGDFWRAYARDPRPGFSPISYLTPWEDREVDRLLMEAYGTFYFRPRYLARSLLAIRSWGELRLKALGGLKM
ncbi:MAG: B12-binding domain-containing radical SAM protein, partial [Candidatus Methylomirabilis sp.]|nr:B12-binding domain-containing radical SAM protein [Deltaproteobacteria bacterium]